MHEFLPSEHFARRLMEIVTAVLEDVGLNPSDRLRNAVYLVVVVIMAFAAGMIIRKLILVVVRRFLSRRFPAINSDLARCHALQRAGRVIPPLILLSLIPFAFNSGHRATHWILMATIIYTIVTFVIAVNAMLTFIWIRYNTRLNAKNLPLKGIVDISKGAMWVIAVIVIISMLVQKSPLALLTGLGAFAAVILLIFKDSILGLVAGVQLSVNDMLRVGDWISIPGTDANGIVIDVSLVVVKVRNWNNTVAMIPPYSLVSSNFINWRYMKETGSRQIEMSIPIDVSSVRPLSDDELHTIQGKLPMIKNFIDVKLRQRAEGKTANVFNDEAGADGSIDTNMGLLRAYLNFYIPSHPYVYSDRIFMVRILEPTATGFPLQIFCYLTTATWKAYEAIVADIFEHIAAVAPIFGLTVYQQPSDRAIFSLDTKVAPDAPYTGDTVPVISTPDPSTNNSLSGK